MKFIYIIILIGLLLGVTANLSGCLRRSSVKPETTPTPAVQSTAAPAPTGIGVLTAAPVPTSSSNQPPPPASTTTPVPVFSPGSVATLAPAGSPVVSLTPTPTSSPVPLPEEKVDFSYAITDVSGSGFTRTVTARLDNIGTADAHNVWAEVTVKSGTSLIKINGQPYLRVDVGSLPAGQSITKTMKLSIGLLDGLKAMKNGASITMTIHSDEATETFSYDYQA